jgi:hypothetical protein
LKTFIGAGVLAILAFVIRFGVFLPVGVDISIHDTYWVVPLRVVSFWILLGTAAVWLLIAAYKFSHHGS